MSALDFRNEQNTFGLLQDTIRADQDAAHQARVAQEAQTRRAEDAGLTLGEVDDHLDALRRLEKDVLGHEYESLQQIADAIETVRDDFEGLL